jgi:hypothetical protein
VDLGCTTELELADDVDENSGICNVCNLPYKDAGLLKRVCWGMKAEDGSEANTSEAVRFIPVDVVNSGMGRFCVSVGDA